MFWDMYMCAVPWEWHVLWDLCTWALTWGWHVLWDPCMCAQAWGWHVLWQLPKKEKSLYPKHDALETKHRNCSMQKNAWCRNNIKPKTNSEFTSNRTYWRHENGLSHATQCIPHRNHYVSWSDSYLWPFPDAWRVNGMTSQNLGPSITSCDFLIPKD